MMECMHPSQIILNEQNKKVSGTLGGISLGQSSTLSSECYVQPSMNSE